MNNTQCPTKFAGHPFPYHPTSPRAWGRMAIKERLHFLEYAYGSLAEVSCQLDISQALGYITEEELTMAESLSFEIGRLLSGLRKSLMDKYNIINKEEEKDCEN